MPSISQNLQPIRQSWLRVDMSKNILKWDEKKQTNVKEAKKAILKDIIILEIGQCNGIYENGHNMTATFFAGAKSYSNSTLFLVMILRYLASFQKLNENITFGISFYLDPACYSQRTKKDQLKTSTKPQTYGPSYTLAATSSTAL